ncbi:GNAT family N-acetyltransferase [Luteibaculum oceani]|uniref:GNAT family N-acetyltransferase n=1 Tax=Luteibaculum oceani TaxID=1294296 RepID=A0A5C6VAP9_9FLAO|nr:GNAT family N-acetyltransferase [Luteibaculum oceani]TXC81426.1 GNAT family N-acetyltransferase [Luteibaculum oceani]
MEVKALAWDSVFFGFPVGMVDYSNLPVNIGNGKSTKEFQLIYNTHPHISPPFGYTESYQGGKVTFQKEIHHPSLPILHKDFCLSTRKPSTQDYNLKRSLQELYFLAGHRSRFKLDQEIGDLNFKRLYTHWLNESFSGKMGDTVYQLIYKEKLVGVLSLKKTANTTSISIIAVHPKFQGQEIGTTLIRFAEIWGEIQGCTSLEVNTQTCNTKSIALYKKCGFSIKNQINVQHFWKK